MNLTTWQDQISQWYRNGYHDQITPLEQLLYQVPDSVFGPELTTQQSKALACWLDGCLRVFQHSRTQHPHRAYRILQYTSAKLEQAACRFDNDQDIRNWCMKRLQHLTVLCLEFCNKQIDQGYWQHQANNVIEAHVALTHYVSYHCLRKDDQGYRQ
ncbi:transcriptional regulator [Vibrio sp. CAU 1672]|uniref:transcriptional regulator n=1 Tax=Vibrio sp. CAU 1672 TaxID=3032594 RepID=UPI0023D9A7DE|nr:transcriptional regulator [Vibrio sp. CAU 1672]MDF2155238.1 transcriptional regulator [Vibrio sp. CAU 1672]